MNEKDLYTDWYARRLERRERQRQEQIDLWLEFAVIGVGMLATIVMTNLVAGTFGWIWAAIVAVGGVFLNVAGLAWREHLRNENREQEKTP